MSIIKFFSHQEIILSKVTHFYQTEFYHTQIILTPKNIFYHKKVFYQFWSIFISAKIHDLKL